MKQKVNEDIILFDGEDINKLDEDTIKRRKALSKLKKMSPDEIIQLMIKYGILTEDLKLAPPYGDEPREGGDFDFQHRTS